MFGCAFGMCVCVRLGAIEMRLLEPLTIPTKTTPGNCQPAFQFRVVLMDAFDGVSYLKSSEFVGKLPV